ncbi:hypothetical protein CJ030_MR2G020358 [Morella rubra]|uniref:S-protein homolog n=1 Tax=Morella rubra TaxID=262757 RepID=A0A6A1W7K4_9ROSI|nr:hypothetical protein CJ030_MR0G020341 [Morella rubra]KAB1221244.1 hypothetical protein CJ030_MR2G020358 [Morella rubra]
MNALQRSVLLLSLLHLVLGTEAKVYVYIVNRLGKGRSMTLRYKSKNNDLGYQVVKDGAEVHWRFGVNFWRTTLFYCNVKWGNSPRYHFDAYSDDRDYERCLHKCLWQIRRCGTLYGYNEASRKWEKFAFKNKPDFET